MSQINEIGNRFDKALSVIQVTNKEISEVFNTSSQNISNLKKADRMNDLMSQIAAKYKININWLVTGNGEMFVNQDTQTNNLQNSNIAGSGVDNSKGSSHTFNNTQTINCNEFTKTLFQELCEKYKEEQKTLQSLIFKLIQDANSK